SGLWSQGFRSSVTIRGKDSTATRRSERSRELRRLKNRPQKQDLFVLENRPKHERFSGKSRENKRAKNVLFRPPHPCLDELLDRRLRDIEIHARGVTLLRDANGVVCRE